MSSPPDGISFAPPALLLALAQARCGFTRRAKEAHGGGGEFEGRMGAAILGIHPD